MKQAFLITAHKDPALVLNLLEQLNDQCDVFLHLDKRTRKQNSWDEVWSHPRLVFRSQKYASRWGSWNILASSLMLLDNAIKYQPYAHYHLISGQDQLCRPIGELITMSDNNRGHSFLEFFPLPFEHWDNGGLSRLDVFHFNAYIDRSKYSNVLLNLIAVQKRLKLKRKIPGLFGELFGGSAWWSLSKSAAEFVVNYTHAKPSFFKWLKFSMLPDELYVSTILAHSSLAKDIKPSIRFVKWLGKEGKGSPKILELDDLNEIKDSEAFFARKFESVLSKELIEKINGL